MRINSIGAHFERAPRPQMREAGGYAWVEWIDPGAAPNMTDLGFHVPEEDLPRIRKAVSAWNAALDDARAADLIAKTEGESIG